MELDIETLTASIKKLEKKFKEKKDENISNDELIEIEKILSDVIDMVKNIEYKNKQNFLELNEKIEYLKSLNRPNIDISLNKDNESRIKELYERGLSIEDISKELRIPPGEVKLIIEISKSKT